jgi:hypothetical protein
MNTNKHKSNLGAAGAMGTIHSCHCFPILPTFPILPILLVFIRGSNSVYSKLRTQNSKTGEQGLLAN